MTDYLAANWLALVSLALAVIGGVPGIVSLLQHLRRRPRFVVTPANLINGTIRFDSAGPEFTHVTFAVTIANSGETPLTPAVYDLELQHEGRWILFERSLIPEGIVFESSDQDISAPHASTDDLQKSKASIAPGTPARGYLMFVTNKLSLTQLRAIRDPKFRFICRDVFGKKYVAEVEPKLKAIERGMA